MRRTRAAGPRRALKSFPRRKDAPPPPPRLPPCVSGAPWRFAAQASRLVQNPQPLLSEAGRDPLHPPALRPHHGSPAIQEAGHGCWHSPGKPTFRWKQRRHRPMSIASERHRHAYAVPQLAHARVTAAALRHGTPGRPLRLMPPRRIAPTPPGMLSSPRGLRAAAAEREPAPARPEARRG